MSFDNHKLKNYFDAAKAQKPPLELDDIKKQLSRLPHQSADSVPTHRLASVSSAYRAGLLFTLGILTIATSFIMSYNNGFVFLTRNNPSHKVNRPLPESTKRLYLKTDSDQQLSPELISPKSSNKHRYGQVDKTKIRGLALSSVDSLRPPVRFVELPMAALERLGFRIDSHGIHYQMFLTREETNGKPDLMWVEISKDKKQVGFTSLDTTMVEPKNAVKALFVTDRTGGNHPIRYRTRLEDPRKMELAYFSEVANLLVPVLISVPADRGRHEAVFWFEPTAEFLKELPAILAEEIKTEYERVQAAKTKTVGVNEPAKQAFKYFESAGAAATSAYPVSVFPNPARDRISISFTLEQPQRLCIKLVDLSGRIIKVLSPTQRVLAGPFFREYTLSGVSAGLYVVLIETAMGQMQTQRLVVEQ